MTSNVNVFLSQRLQIGIANLLPAYFALVMATGIIAIATHLLGIPGLDWFLLAVAGLAYVVLFIFTLIRLIRYFPKIVADINSHARGPGFFTVVAATCVLGSALVIIPSAFAIAKVLWFFGIVVWFLVMYTFFPAVVIREDKPSLETGINGAWLPVVV